MVYLGPWKSAASRHKYDRVVGEWMARGRSAPADPSTGITVSELLVRYFRWAKAYYQGGSREVEQIRFAVRTLRKLYGPSPASQFGPLALKAVREEMIKANICRNEINKRKSLTDLVSCCGAERDRFTREVLRLQAYRCRALVVESTWDEIEAGGWKSRVTPQTVIRSLLSWQAEGLPIMLCGDHSRAGRMVSRLLYTYARHRWRELRRLAGEVRSESSIFPTPPVLPRVAR